MPNLQDIVYHGIIAQIRRVLKQMSDDEIDAGLSAFEDGAKNWSDCFFARTVQERMGMSLTAIARKQQDTPERTLQHIYEIDTPIPFRIVWRLFDEVGGSLITRPQLIQLIHNIRDERRPDDVLTLIRSIDFTNAEQTEVTCQ